jgi:hypothetical protein
MRNNRSNVELEAGYGVLPRLGVTVSAALQRTHGGILAPLSAHYHDHELEEFQPVHDRIMRANFFLMSAGATVALSRKVSLTGTYIWTVSGQNTHAVGGFAIGASWAFTRGLSLGS